MLVGAAKLKPSLHNFLLRVHLLSSSFSLTLTRKRLVANEIRLLVSSRNSSINTNSSSSSSYSFNNLNRILT